MNTFKTQSHGRIHVHILEHTRFRTKDLMIRLHTPMNRQTVTSTALIPYLWMNGTKKRPSTQAVMMAADDLYGTVVRTSLGKRGGFHVLEAAASIPDVSGLTDEDVVQHATHLAVDMLVDHAANEAAFSQSSVNQEIDLHKRRIEAGKDDKMSYALQQCLAKVAEDDASSLPRLGYIDDLGGLHTETLFERYESIFKNAEIHVYLVGPFQQADRLAEIIIQALETKVPQQNASDLRVAPLKPGQNRGFQEVHETQEVAQAQLDLGYRTGVNFADDAYAKLMMMNGVLGGFAHSKLFINVREKHSLAYSVWSHLEPMTGVLAIMTGIAPKEKQRALEIIEQQLQAIAHGEVSDEEIDFTLRGLENQYTVLLDQPSAMANWHYQGIIAGRDRDIQEMIQDLRSVSKTDIVDAVELLVPHTIYFLSGEGQGNA